jgi:NADH dehydrogenase
MNVPRIDLPRVVIVGAGFAGLQFAKNINSKYYQVVLLDKNNYHTFQPLLYQVATSGLEPDSIAYPIRKVFANKKNFHFRMTEVESIDYTLKSIETSEGALTYDYIVVATGADTNFFGMKDVESNAFPMKSLLESLNLRSKILENFEQALYITDLEERKKLMSFAIVGGGPTGVELAGALSELKRKILPKDYPDLDIRQMQINLIQGADKLLDAMSPQASQKAEDFLTKLGVHVWKNIHVNNYDGKTVSTNTDEVFNSATVIWAAGVQGDAISGLQNECIVERANRIKVDEFNRVEHYTDIFALGDVASMTSEDYPRGHPMMAQPALQQGKLLAKNIVALLKNKPLKAFSYHDKGSMATIGRNKAVVDLPRWKFQGVFAWFVWMFVHLFSLIGFRNRAVVFFNWLYNYIRFDRESRLIIRPFKKKNNQSFN